VVNQRDVSKISISKRSNNLLRNDYLKNTYVKNMAVSAAVAVSTLALAAPADAIEFKYGEVSGFFDSTLSVGASMRVAKQDMAKIGWEAGGKRTGRSGNNPRDDGNLNFEQYDFTGATVKATHDLEVNWRNYRAFVRGTYFYDYIYNQTELAQGYRLGHDQRREVGQVATLLDSFVGGTWEVDDHVIEARVGKQVLSWGESTFFLNGINVINPIDINKFRLPGSQIKEALTPVWLAWASAGITQNISAEVFYQLKWEEFALDPQATFFGSDVFGSGAPFREGSAQGGLNNTFGIVGAVPESATHRIGFDVPKGSQIDARDDGQYGIALHWYVPELDGTEFGFYFLNYHSRLPLAYVRAGNTDDSLSNIGINPANGFTPSATAAAILNPALADGTLAAAVSGGAAAATNIGELAALFAVDPTNAGNILQAAQLGAVGGIVGGAGGGQAGLDALAAAGAPRQAEVLSQLAFNPDFGGIDCLGSIGVPLTADAADDAFGFAGATPTSFCNLALIADPSTLNFGQIYPEDIKKFGLSFNTFITQGGGAGFSLQGEVSYTHDQPLQINVTELFLAGFDGGGITNEFGILDTGRGNPQNGDNSVFPGQLSLVGNSGNNAIVPSFVRKDVIQAQATAVKVFGPNAFVGDFMKSDQLVLLGEVGGMFVRDMDDAGVLALAGPQNLLFESRTINQPGIPGVPGTDGFNGATIAQAFESFSNPLCPGSSPGGIQNNDGSNTCGLQQVANHATRFSWGYALLAIFDYNNAFYGINLQPSIAWQHDVKGFSPSPIQNWIEDRKSISVALGANYIGAWEGEIRYTNFFGGGIDNQISDRDFVSANIKYSF